MSATLLSDLQSVRPRQRPPMNDLASKIALRTLSRSPAPDADAWGGLWSQIRQIEARHAEWDDAETPRLPTAVVQGARRLIRWLENRGESPPTVMTGTCDATITCEWHDWGGEGAFRSLDVLSENEAEEYVAAANGQPILRTLIF